MKMNTYKSAIYMDLLISGTEANCDIQELSEYDVKSIWLGMRLDSFRT